MSGYVDCACRDCFEIAIGEPGEAFCSDCEKADCSGGDSECDSPTAYGASEEDEGEDAV